MVISEFENFTGFGEGQFAADMRDDAKKAAQAINSSQELDFTVNFEADKKQPHEAKIIRYRMKASVAVEPVFFEKKGLFWTLTRCFHLLRKIEHFEDNELLIQAYQKGVDIDKFVSDLSVTGQFRKHRTEAWNQAAAELRAKIGTS